MTEKDRATAMEVTEHDNQVIDMFRGQLGLEEDELKKEIEIVLGRIDFYEELESAEMKEAIDRIYDKIQIVKNNIKQIIVIENTVVLILLLNCLKIKLFNPL